MRPLLHLKSKQDHVPVRDGIERLVPQRCVPPPAALSVALIKAPGLEAKGLSAVSEGKEETHERKQVGLVRVQALFQQQQVELEQSKKHGGEGGKWGRCLRSVYLLHVGPEIPKSVARARAHCVQAKGALAGLLRIATRPLQRALIIGLSPLVSSMLSAQSLSLIHI